MRVKREEWKVTVSVQNKRKQMKNNNMPQRDEREVSRGSLVAVGALGALGALGFLGLSPDRPASPFRPEVTNKTNENKTNLCVQLQLGNN